MSGWRRSAGCSKPASSPVIGRQRAARRALPHRAGSMRRRCGRPRPRSHWSGTSSTRRPTISDRQSSKRWPAGWPNAMGQASALLPARRWPRVSADSCGGGGEQPAAAAYRFHERRARSAEADAGGKGRHLRHRRPRYQAVRQHAADEEGHGRCCQCPRPGGADHGSAPTGAPQSAHSRSRQRDLRQRLSAGRHSQEPQGAHRRDRQHRCRGPADPGRRAGTGRRGSAGSDDRHGDPDRRGAGGAWSGPAALLYRRRPVGGVARQPWQGGERSAVATAAVASLQRAVREQDRRPQQCRVVGLCRVDHRRPVPSKICRAGAKLRAFRHLRLDPTAKPGRPVGGDAQGIRALFSLCRERWPA